MDKESTTYTGLVRDVERFVTGIDEVERLIGKDFVFHDAEIDDIHVCRAADVVTIRMWTWSGVNEDKYYDVTWKIEGCMALNICDYDVNGGSPYVFELEFEYRPYYEDRIVLLLDGAGITVDCKHITITVEESTRKE